MPSPNYYFVERILQSPGVRRKCAEVADRMARQAAQIAAAEKAPGPVLRSDGTRPKGRPFSRVAMAATTEFGDSKTKRYRILGRVVGL